MERLKKAVHKVMDDQKELGKRFREVVEQAVARVDKRVVCIMVICSHGGGFTPRKTIPDVIGPEHTESVTYISPVPLGICNVSLRNGQLCEDLRKRIAYAVRAAKGNDLTTESIFAPAGIHMSIGESLIHYRNVVAEHPQQEKNVLFRTLGRDIVNMDSIWSSHSKYSIYNT